MERSGVKRKAKQGSSPAESQRKRLHFAARVKYALQSIRPVTLTLHSRLTDLLLQNSALDQDAVLYFPRSMSVGVAQLINFPRSISASADNNAASADNGAAGANVAHSSAIPSVVPDAPTSVIPSSAVSACMEVDAGVSRVAVAQLCEGAALSRAGAQPGIVPHKSHPVSVKRSRQPSAVSRQPPRGNALKAALRRRSVVRLAQFGILQRFRAGVVGPALGSQPAGLNYSLGKYYQELGMMVSRQGSSAGNATVASAESVTVAPWLPPLTGPSPTLQKKLTKLAGLLSSKNLHLPPPADALNAELVNSDESYFGRQLLEAMGITVERFARASCSTPLSELEQLRMRALAAAENRRGLPATLGQEAASDCEPEIVFDPLSFVNQRLSLMRIRGLCRDAAQMRASDPPSLGNLSTASVAMSEITQEETDQNVRCQVLLAATHREIADRLARGDTSALADLFACQVFPVLASVCRSQETQTEMADTLPPVSSSNQACQTVIHTANQSSQAVIPTADQGSQTEVSQPPEKEQKCLICLGNLDGLSDGNQVQALLIAQCNHGGHWKCMLDAYTFSEKCPYCRAPVDMCTVKVSQGGSFVDLDMPLTLQMRIGRRGGNCLPSPLRLQPFSGWL